ncbi:chaplin [Streptomyces sp. NBC_00344]|uniref:chaplin n=1 Tax=Streptomyces sp. NBC_00344 TaxID=2975720 RepID=UPI002E24727F
MRFKSAALLAATGTLILAGAAGASADGGARGVAVGSPGILSGNVIQVPISVPINVCGNSVNLIGAFNPTFGNTCINGEFGRGYDDGRNGDHHRRRDDNRRDNNRSSKHQSKNHRSSNHR